MLHLVCKAGLQSLGRDCIAVCSIIAIPQTKVEAPGLESSGLEKSALRCHSILDLARHACLIQQRHRQTALCPED